MSLHCWFGERIGVIGSGRGRLGEIDGFGERGGGRWSRWRCSWWDVWFVLIQVDTLVDRTEGKRGG